MRSESLTLAQLADVCAELVERWDDLAGFFGTESSGALVELRSVPSLNVLIFNDRLSRPQFAILSWLLATGNSDIIYLVGVQSGFFMFFTVFIIIFPRENTFISKTSIFIRESHCNGYTFFYYIVTDKATTNCFRLTVGSNCTAVALFLSKKRSNLLFIASHYSEKLHKDFYYSANRKNNGFLLF